MSGRDRSDRVAIVACVCTAVVFLLGMWVGGYHYDRSQQSTSIHDRPTLAVLQASPEGYEAICNVPINRIDAELCLQWRSAQAATDSAMWAKRQFILGVLGICGVVGTVFYARRALIESRRIGQAQVRAYPTIGEVEIGYTQTNGGHLWLRTRIDNRGNSPALDFDMFFLLTFFVNDTTVELYVPFDCGALSTDGNVYGPIHFVDAKIPSDSFFGSVAVHIEVAWFCLDVFDRETSGFEFYLIGGRPSPNYVASPKDKGPTPSQFSSGRIESFRKKRNPYKFA